MLIIPKTIQAGKMCDDLQKLSNGFVSDGSDAVGRNEANSDDNGAQQSESGDEGSKSEETLVDFGDKHFDTECGRFDEKHLENEYLKKYLTSIHIDGEQLDDRQIKEEDSEYEDFEDERSNDELFNDKHNEQELTVVELLEDEHCEDSEHPVPGVDYLGSDQESEESTQNAAELPGQGTTFTGPFSSLSVLHHEQSENRECVHDELNDETMSPNNNFRLSLIASSSAEENIHAQDGESNDPVIFGPLRPEILDTSVESTYSDQGSTFTTLYNNPISRSMSPMSVDALLLAGISRVPQLNIPTLPQRPKSIFDRVCLRLPRPSNMPMYNKIHLPDIVASRIPMTGFDWRSLFGLVIPREVVSGSTDSTEGPLVRLNQRDNTVEDAEDEEAEEEFWSPGAILLRLHQASRFKAITQGRGEDVVDYDLALQQISAFTLGSRPPTPKKGLFDWEKPSTPVIQKARVDGGGDKNKNSDSDMKPLSSIHHGACTPDLVRDDGSSPSDNGSTDPSAPVNSGLDGKVIEDYIEQYGCDPYDFPPPEDAEADELPQPEVGNGTTAPAAPVDPGLDGNVVKDFIEQYGCDPYDVPLPPDELEEPPRPENAETKPKPGPESSELEANCAADNQVTGVAEADVMWDEMADMEMVDSPYNSADESDVDCEMFDCGFDRELDSGNDTEMTDVDDGNDEDTEMKDMEIDEDKDTEMTECPFLPEATFIPRPSFINQPPFSLRVVPVGFA
ncbi:MAG: hypothetical protein Q9170_005121 [Blastenia crenularia]